mmetsp:Transcript_39782/g.81462  ORF Transcript_39782/g.81462 Transcript_39782/m.81462 type:complete len:212 (-) Transcript_39782:42-677(-)
MVHRQPELALQNRQGGVVDGSSVPTDVVDDGLAVGTGVGLGRLNIRQWNNIPPLFVHRNARNSSSGLFFVIIAQLHHTIQRGDYKHMATRQNADRVFVEVAVCVLVHANHVRQLSTLAAALLTKGHVRTKFATDCRTLMPTSQQFRAALVARSTVARSAAGKAASTLVLAFPHTWLHARGTHLVAFLGTLGMDALECTAAGARGTGGGGVG